MTKRSYHLNQKIASKPVIRNIKPHPQQKTSVEGYRAHGQKLYAPVFAAIDSIPELQGAGVILELSPTHIERLRPSHHASRLQTYVVLTPYVTVHRIEVHKESPSWLQQHSESIINCGSAGLAWTGVGLSALAEGPSLGTSTVPMVLSYGAATASSVQCAVAIKKETDPGFAEYLQSKDGQWYNTFDVLADVISVADGAGSLKEVLKSGKIWKDGKVLMELNETSKGQLLKAVTRLEKSGKDLSYFRNTVELLIKEGKVADPAGRTFSNNILRRALPYMTRQVTQRKLSTIVKAMGTVAAAVQSHRGENGVIHFAVRIVQERIDGRKSR